MLGLLATLPLLIFAGFAPFARLGQILGIERTLAGCLALVVVGIALRFQGSTSALFSGTAILAIGIAIANVLLPSVIKRDFPDLVGRMTTAYAMVMSLTGALATGFAAPFAAHLAGGWRSSLAVWVVFAALALLFWFPEIRKESVPVASHRPSRDSITKPGGEL
jgi:MFS transporter, CP family, cyanate transporter